ncbi:MAG TPA: cytochrome C oxidase assembly protein, partial [Campylobacterales bacterium]|nr:cytochrome C oxidase assembly protein [Campylobacterales bacterium]
VFKIVEYKFLFNILESPLLLAGIVLGLGLILFALYSTLYKGSRKSIWFHGFGTVILVTTILSLIGFNHTAIYPSLSDINSSLSIVNSSGSHYTLTAMSYVSLMVPFVLAYIYFVWRSMDKTKISSEEIEADSHHY